MLTHLWRHGARILCRITIFVVALGVLHCVSVSLPNRELYPANGVSMLEPAKPFLRHDMPSVDAAWKNPQSGAVISYVSECGEDHKPALLTVREDVLRALSGREVKSDLTTKFLGEPAIRTITQGHVDGVASTVELLIFNKDNCNYILSLVTSPSQYLRDAPLFDNFTQGFKTP